MLPSLWKVPMRILGEGAVPSEPHLSMKLRLLKSRKNLFSFANGFIIRAIRTWNLENLSVVDWCSVEGSIPGRRVVPGVER
jgi:hypothetical protein